MQVSNEQMDMLRACLNKIYDVCDEMDAAGTSVELGTERFTVRKLFEIEVTAYLLYLSISDFVIEQEEVDTINSIMGRTYSLDDCVRLVDAHGMRDPGFGKHTPASFRLLCEHTQARGASIADTLISFYDVLGVVLATADDEFALPEAQAHKHYMDILRGYKELAAS